VTARRDLLPKILADPAERRELMSQCIVAGQAREGVTTTMKQARDAYDKVLAKKILEGPTLGRPIVLTPCPWCKKEFASREFRKHVVGCRWRVKRGRRVAGISA
jgi:hypothetical protein